MNKERFALSITLKERPDIPVAIEAERGRERATGGKWGNDGV
jgi:hypothetical protein